MAKSVIIDISIETKNGKDSLGELNKGAKTTLSTLRDLEDAAALLNDELKHTQVGTKEFKALSKELKKVEAGIADINSADMTFLDELSALPGIAGLAGQSIQGLGGAMSLLAANPLIAAITALVAIFTAGINRMKETQAGTEALSGVMAALSQALKPIMDAFATIAGILIDALMPVLELLAPILEGIGWVFENVVAPVIQFVADAFKALVQGIKDALTWLGLMDAETENYAKKAAELAKAQERLLAIQRKLDVQNAKDLRKIEQLKNVRDDELKSINERIKANEEIQKIEEKRIARAIKFNETQLLVTQEQLALDKDNIELQKQVSTLLVEQQDLLSQSDGILAEYISNRQALIREELDLLRTQKEGQTAILEAAEATDSAIYASKRKSINAQLALLKSRGATELSEYKDLLLQLKILDTERTTDLRNRSKDAGREITDIRIDAVKNQYERERQLAEEDFKRFEEDLKKKGTLTEEELALIEARRAETARIIDEINKDEAEAMGLNVATTEQINAEIAKIETEAAMQAELRALQRDKTILLNSTTNEQEKLKITREFAQREKGIRDKYLQDRIDAINTLAQEQLDTLDLEEQAAIRVATSEEEKNRIYAEYAKKRVEIERNAQQEIDGIIQESLNQTQMNSGEKIAQWMSDNAAYIEGIQNTITQSMDLLAQYWEQQAEAAAVKRNDEYEAESLALKNQLDNRVISQKEYDAKVKMLEDKKAQEEKMARLKAFKQQKALNIVNAVMSTANAVLAGLATQPFLPLGIIMGAVAAALGAVQIGIISSQKFTGNRGGIVPGAASKVDSVDAKLAPGEMVINSESASMFPTLLSEINKAGGGISLAPEPVSTLTGGVGGGAGTIYERGNGGAVRAYVVESDISDSQKRVNRMERSAEF